MASMSASLRGRLTNDSHCSLAALKWGVDYIKADDMSHAGEGSREHYHGAEIAALASRHCEVRPPHGAQPSSPWRRRPWIRPRDFDGERALVAHLR